MAKSSSRKTARNKTAPKKTARKAKRASPPRGRKPPPRKSVRSSAPRAAEKVPKAAKWVYAFGGGQAAGRVKGDQIHFGPREIQDQGVRGRRAKAIPLRAEGAGAEVGRERGIHAAGDADDGVLEAAPAHELVADELGEPVSDECFVHFEKSVALRVDGFLFDYF